MARKNEHILGAMHYMNHEFDGRAQSQLPTQEDRVGRAKVIIETLKVRGLSKEEVKEPSIWLGKLILELQKVTDETGNK